MDQSTLEQLIESKVQENEWIDYKEEWQANKAALMSRLRTSF
ncbi:MULTISPECIES: hypothetical protein [Weissella]|uniref:Uncharacterized protein n=1 Tax=Weissella fermenti TaxID=2987699 RepID=A0ABT6D5T3_9LACO|nr:MULTISPECIES: hypothetical protein [Weissella]MCW0925949.1 hypothetical protein [Weissella sp. LMG 11983]MDF9300806.1 hypothetical protein [Weissella sp. BK2]